MSAWLISFHGGDATNPSPVNTLLTMQLGGPLPALRELRGFTVGPDGNLYVVNGYKDSSAILQFGAASTLPAAFASIWTNSNLNHPFALVFGPDKNLYVSNQDSNAVTVYQGPSGANPGQYIKTFISSGLRAVRGLACDGQYWYVADEQGGSKKAGAVLIYDLNGNVQENAITVTDPVHLFFDGTQYLYIGSGSGNSVMVYDTKAPNYTPPSIFGTSKPNPAIDATAGLAAPGDGFIYVASRKGRQILKYPLTTSTTAGQGAVLFDQLPDQPEFIALL